MSVIILFIGGIRLVVTHYFRMIRQGELTTKYYGQLRKVSSLTASEIQNIYVSENVV